MNRGEFEHEKTRLYRSWWYFIPGFTCKCKRIRIFWYEKDGIHEDASSRKGTLFDYLEQIDIQASNMYDRLVEQYKKQRNITEELKAQDQMSWVQEMNNIKNCVNEVILNELIYE